ncbi:MAG: hypothetical protein A3A16_03175 [Candidatus Harrisonbacteria bacterium RIFCSPLOWO2_01_FULL_44_18]|uniref:Uncharacterized protein n=1 Tax=Candidatus Harrisonbacteria bacterium RIFCSPLOWO2_01_FULL_44_18 TaxID=1798407 RepID=A0A1G1ZMS2_9BACT|nr:MAG: hypothetical protein A3A16_03175 [Candidatus Harrisonbacteria bacterium RIFCSPLOWO2_01_FULL_44_18]
MLKVWPFGNKDKVAAEISKAPKAKNKNKTDRKYLERILILYNIAEISKIIESIFGISGTDRSSYRFPKSTYMTHILSLYGF